jgi:hypothetical protein
MSETDGASPSPAGRTPRQQTARTMAIFAGVLLLIALAVGSPAGGLAASALAALSALVPAAAGTGAMRWIGIGLVAAGVFGATQFYAGYQRELDRMHDRTRGATTLPVTS